MAKLSDQEVRDLLGGSPDDIGAELASFTDSCEVLSSDRPRLIDTHPMEWVGVFRGHIAGAAADFESLMSQLKTAGAPPAQTIVRFIDNTEKTFIL